MVATQRIWDPATLQHQAELRVVAFYEDLKTGEWAKEIFDRIRNRAPHNTRTKPGLWRFDVLEDDRLRKLASAEAANAAVIIVAARGNRPLPKELLECLEGVLIKTAPARVGLVAVFESTDQGPKESLPACRQLQAVSRKASLRFFSLPCGNLTEMPPAEESVAFVANRLLDNSFLVEAHWSRTWGINE